MAATFSQISSFSHITRNLRLRHRRSSPFLSRRSMLSVSMSLEASDQETSSSVKFPKLSYDADGSSSSLEAVENTYTGVKEPVNGKLGANGTPDSIIPEKRNTSKIHDFCFGIPFGGFVLTGALLGSIFSRNLATLGTGVLFGGAILVFSATSLKVWREGKSSFPFIIGQAVLAATLLWKNFQTYSVSKKLFPSGLYALISAFMLVFYSYVVLSGGNPPPKKLSMAAEATS